MDGDDQGDGVVGVNGDLHLFLSLNTAGRDKT
jgi:hypothetical protein